MNLAGIQKAFIGVSPKNYRRDKVSDPNKFQVDFHKESVTENKSYATLIIHQDKVYLVGKIDDLQCSAPLDVYELIKLDGSKFTFSDNHNMRLEVDLNHQWWQLFQDDKACSPISKGIGIITLAENNSIESGIRNLMSFDVNFDGVPEMVLIDNVDIYVVGQIDDNQGKSGLDVYKVERFENNDQTAVITDNYGAYLHIDLVDLKSAFNNRDNSSLAALNRIYDYFSLKDGDPRNIIKTFYADITGVNGEISHEQVSVPYHVTTFNGDLYDANFHNSAVTTSEAVIDKLIADTMFGGITGDFTHADATERYHAGYMRPHDGISTINLPDAEITLSQFPDLTHWLNQVSSNFSTFNLNSKFHFSSNNTPYKIYVSKGVTQYSCLPLSESGLPELKEGRLQFSSAVDADQKYIIAMLFRDYFTPGKVHSQIVSRKEALLPFLNRKGDYTQLMPFSVAWQADINSSGGLENPVVSIEESHYAAYQSPDVWYAINEDLVASKMVAFLAAAQETFTNNYGVEGPFMPIFSNGNFTFNGPDPNTHWMGFQFRTFLCLSHYYLLSKDPKAKVLIDRFIKWIDGALEEAGALPFSMANGEVDSNNQVHNCKNVGEIEVYRYSPYEYALYISGLKCLSAATGDSQYDTRIKPLLAELKSKQYRDGSFPDTYTGRIYSFHQSEVASALALVSGQIDLIDYAEHVNAQKSSFRRQITQSVIDRVDPVVFPNNFKTLYDGGRVDIYPSSNQMIFSGAIVNYWGGSVQTAKPIRDDLSEYTHLTFTVIGGAAQLLFRIGNNEYTYQVDCHPGDVISIPLTDFVNIVADHLDPKKHLKQGTYVNIGLVGFTATQEKAYLEITIPKFEKL